MNPQLTLIHPACCTNTNYKYPSPIRRARHTLKGVCRDEFVVPQATYIGSMHIIGRIVGGIFTSLEYSQLTDMWKVVDQIRYKSQLTNDICRL